MKFYYNGQLVRTSKTRHYKYAIGSEEHGFKTCSETLDNAKKQLDAKKRYYLQVAKSNLEFAKKPENLKWLKEEYGEDYDPEVTYKNELAHANACKIVELEER